MKRKTVNLYTDGSCAGNPGRGGWAALLEYQEAVRQLSGAEPATTNNRMELTAVIQGLSQLKEPCLVRLYTDSQYVMNGATRWLGGWQEKGWRRADKKPVLNADLWQALAPLLTRHDVRWTWVKGHAGHPQNELADKLARAQSLTPES